MKCVDKTHYIQVYIDLKLCVNMNYICWDIVLGMKLKHLWNPDQDFMAEYGLTLFHYIWNIVFENDSSYVEEM